MLYEKMMRLNEDGKRVDSMVLTIPFSELPVTAMEDFCELETTCPEVIFDYKNKIIKIIEEVNQIA